MPLNCKKCEFEPDTPLWCSECKSLCCQACFPDHKAHESKVSFLCQQCETSPEKQETYFCENCEQHLCYECNEKIHNKGKRAKHTRYLTTAQTLQIKRVFIICDDVLEYYGFINFQAMLMEISDLSSNDKPEIVIIEKTKGLSDMKSKTDLIIQQFNAQRQFDEDYCNGLKAHYPGLLSILLIESTKSKKYFEIVKKCRECKIQLKQLGEPVVKKPMFKASRISGSSAASIPNSSFNNKSNISARYPNHEPRTHLGINISTSTENSLRKRKRKAPIIYFHPYIVSKQDPRSEIEDHYRDLATSGTLMIKKKNCEKYDSTVLRTFMRNIGEQEVEYVSLIIDNISIECLYWVIRSIEEDMMAPTEKLILSRLKQSFDIKVHSKLWSYVLRYLISREYERDRFELDRIAEIPKLVIKPFNNQDNYIMYCKPDDRTPVEWTYEDLSKLDETATQWKQFLQLINDYFAKNSQIGGGRYGCVQFIKFNAKSPLKECSLGKMSMFVQQAINRGIIRYHKTLLVSNKEYSESEQSQTKCKNQSVMIQLQRSIKISTLQLLLFDLFEQCGPNTPISLAQIPQNLRKNVHFEINYIQLGFPKLKNLLTTMNDFVDTELNKSSISYAIKADTYKLIQQKRQLLSKETDQFLKATMDQLLKIITSYNVKGMVIEQLYNQLSSKIGFFLDYRIFNVPDFFNFITYYGQNYFQVQNNMGYIIVYKKGHDLKNSSNQTSTPTFRQACGIQSIKNIACLNWETNFLIESNPKEEEDEEENQSESYSDYKSIYNIIDDDGSESKSYPNTVIVKDGSIHNNELNLTRFAPIKQNSDYSDGGFEQGIWAAEYDTQKTKPKVHNRMYSNTTQQKTQHYRVYSNMSRN